MGTPLKLQETGVQDRLPESLKRDGGELMDDCEAWVGCREKEGIWRGEVLPALTTLCAKAQMQADCEASSHSDSLGLPRNHQPLS